MKINFNSKDTKWEQNNNWKDGKDAPTSGDYIVEIQTDVVLTSEVSIFSLTIDEGATLTIEEGGKLTVGDGNTLQKGVYGDLHVAKGGEAVFGKGIVTVRNFILDAALGDTVTGGYSGQVQDDNHKLVVNGDAYFQMDLDPSGVTTFGWYDFVVPFAVEAGRGVYLQEGDKLRQLANGTDYAIMRYDEGLRASGAYDWK